MRRSSEGGALSIFEVLGAALFRGRRSLEGGAKKRKYGIRKGLHFIEAYEYRKREKSELQRKSSTIFNAARLH